jgi:Icc-related predicted phosphoesterase
MKIALFSDVHGRLRIMLRMLQCWQIQHNTFLDGALLAGDIGCFPEESRFDKATRRWVERDPEEAGFLRYFMRPKGEIEAVFDGIKELDEFSAVKCGIYFVPGNHEDYEYIHACRAKAAKGGNALGSFPVDCYSRLRCIENGTVIKLRGGDGMVLRVGALWGIENAKEGSPKKISEGAAESLIQRRGGKMDLLLTHDAPAHSYTAYSGSRTISRVLEACNPGLHLFGHVHPADGCYEFKAEPLQTRSWIFEDVGFGRNCDGNLKGSMGILSVDSVDGKPEFNVEVVEDEWLSKMRFKSWEYVWPEG